MCSSDLAELHSREYDKAVMGFQSRLVFMAIVLLELPVSIVNTCRREHLPRLRSGENRPLVVSNMLPWQPQPSISCSGRANMTNCYIQLEIKSRIPHFQLHCAPSHISVFVRPFLDQNYPNHWMGRGDPIHGLLADWNRGLVTTFMGMFGIYYMSWASHHSS